MSVMKALCRPTPALAAVAGIIIIDPVGRLVYAGAHQVLWLQHEISLSAPPEVDVTVALPREKVTLANLLQLYTHDFSEFWAGGPDGELGDDGRFPYYSFLDDYWRDAGRIPLLLRIGGHVAGFALINDRSHSGLPLDRNVAEFFVVRKHRRGGAGTAAARKIFTLYPGVWEAAVARRNTAALAFWRKAVAGCPGVADIEELDRSDEAWDGPILRFRVG
ncbi:MAG: GNAT family N-acetyltransferase [Caulobacteraceae bacterium]